ncbi:MAG: response regulator [Deinococcales bacterium]
MAQILVIEDSPAMSKLIELKLKAEGHQVRVAEDGQRGFMAILNEPPELLVLDVDLPYMDGFEVARLVRQHEQIHNLPILMLTGRSDVDSRLRGLEHADDYINKPFNSQELNARVKPYCAAAVLCASSRRDGWMNCLEKALVNMPSLKRLAGAACQWSIKPMIRS